MKYLPRIFPNISHQSIRPGCFFGRSPGSWPCKSSLSHSVPSSQEMAKRPPQRPNLPRNSCRAGSQPRATQGGDAWSGAAPKQMADITRGDLGYIMGIWIMIWIMMAIFFRNQAWRCWKLPDWEMIYRLTNEEILVFACHIQVLNDRRASL